MSTPFTRQIYALVARIPEGKVLSYGQIAFLCGRPRASRIVGAAMASAPHALPCHRVVYQDGSLCKGGVFGSPDIQRQMLAAEGVTFTPEGKVRMALHRYLPEEIPQG